MAAVWRYKELHLVLLCLYHFLNLLEHSSTCSAMLLQLNIIFCHIALHFTVCKITDASSHQGLTNPRRQVIVANKNSVLATGLLLAHLLLAPASCKTTRVAAVNGLWNSSTVAEGGKSPHFGSPTGFLAAGPWECLSCSPEPALTVPNSPCTDRRGERADQLLLLPSSPPVSAPHSLAVLCLREGMCGWEI